MSQKAYGRNDKPHIEDSFTCFVPTQRQVRFFLNVDPISDFLSVLKMFSLDWTTQKRI